MEHRAPTDSRPQATVEVGCGCAMVLLGGEDAQQYLASTDLPLALESAINDALQECFAASRRGAKRTRPSLATSLKRSAATQSAARLDEMRAKATAGLSGGSPPSIQNEVRERLFGLPQGNWFLQRLQRMQQSFDSGEMSSNAEAAAAAEESSSASRSPPSYPMQGPGGIRNRMSAGQLVSPAELAQVSTGTDHE